MKGARDFDMAMRDATRQRLDHAMVARGLASTRSQARDLILHGKVMVDGEIVTKQAALVGASAVVTLPGIGRAAYVSRGAHKLAAGLDHFRLDPARRTVLDVGASTGGFTQVLLERGASRVHAVDVGHGQLAEVIRRDTRVVVHEKMDARRLDRVLVPDPIEAIVADVSFISLTQALPGPLALAAPGAWLVALIKPQFEAGREAVGKGGLVRDPADRERAVERVRTFLAAVPGWRVLGVTPSPITGGDGNEEYLIGAVHDG